MRIQNEPGLKAEPSFHPHKEVYFSSNPLPETTKEDTKFDLLINVPLDHICAVVADVMGVEKNAIRGKAKQKQVSLARGTLIYIARAGGWQPVEIRKEFGFNPGTIAHHLSRFRQDSLSKEVEEILEKLTLSLNLGDH
jgi:chromosomal replication initiation ATPase DnaA